MNMPATPEARASGFRYYGTLPMRTQLSAGRPTGTSRCACERPSNFAWKYFEKIACNPYYVGRLL